LLGEKFLCGLVHFAWPWILFWLIIISTLYLSTEISVPSKFEICLNNNCWNIGVGCWPFDCQISAFRGYPSACAPSDGHSKFITSGKREEYC